MEGRWEEGKWVTGNLREMKICAWLPVLIIIDFYP
jgi:hypothetical protein